MSGRFRVSWEMPPPTVVAFEYEDRYGPGIWRTLTDQQWDALPWHPVVNETDDDSCLDQYRQLKEWAETHEQPIRNVKLERQVSQPAWEEVPA